MLLIECSIVSIIYNKKTTKREYLGTSVALLWTMLYERLYDISDVSCLVRSEIRSRISLICGTVRWIW